jgi:hypothetical protein
MHLPQEWLALCNAGCGLAVCGSVSKIYFGTTGTLLARNIAKF